MVVRLAIPDVHRQKVAEEPVSQLDKSLSNPFPLHEENLMARPYL
jgi:hypothetical protein